MGAVVMIIASLLLSGIAIVTLWWTMHAWRTPETLANTRFPATRDARETAFSLLLPARHETEVLEHTVRRLLESSHTNFEIIIITGHDDPGTTAVGQRLADAEPDRVRLVIDHHEVKNKPKALNTALPFCRGDIIGVFDAEDQVHPQLLNHVGNAFHATSADVVQGGVQLINIHSSWYSVRNCLEYFFWFRSRLHLHAEKGFIPLGGNTVFVRTDVLREVDGWDQDCLAEDCDLGVRLSSRGKKVVVAYDASMVTREETPNSLGSLLKQRTRWNQGFLQVLSKGDWKQLPTLGHRVLALYTLCSPFLQAFSGLLIPLGVAAALVLDPPAGVAILTFIPVIPTLATLAFEVVGLHDFGRQYDLRIRFLDYLRLIFGALPYQVMLTVAAIRAVVRWRAGRNNWELTEHVGAHLTPAATTTPATPAASTVPAADETAVIRIPVAAGGGASPDETVVIRLPATTSGGPSPDETMVLRTAVSPALTADTVLIPTARTAAAQQSMARESAA
jgi:cellulose synthase/poly-beta-1,6-N-acetylglucosamine synthase-like glycosyltransferase